ncbi:hypothetical protein [Lacunimicrobium album]
MMSSGPVWVTAWVNKLAEIEAWASEAQWSCRRIEKQIKELQFGNYKAPGLMMQKEFTKILMEPIGSRADGDDGVIDMYMMPMYDDMATIVFEDGKWKIHYLFSPAPELTGVVSADDFPLFEFQKESFSKALEDMSSHAA